MKKDKARDIARGVLPSTARKSARDDKRAYHSKHRSAQRMVNHAINRSLTVVDDDTLTLYTDPDLFDDFTEPDTFDGYHAATKKPNISWDDMNEIVRDRRNADKLGPLISWATATEKNKMVGWDVADKIAYFKAVLPDSLQGRHALGHVKDALDLHTDEFLYGGYYNRPAPITKEVFRSDLARHLSTTKTRAALRSFILDTVPVAAHAAQANNKIRTTEAAVDEDGNRRTGRLPTGIHYTITVEVYIPQILAVTCDDCAFLRNDPLATTTAINRFVEIVWTGRSYDFLSRLRFHPSSPYHGFMREIVDYVNGAK